MTAYSIPAHPMVGELFRERVTPTVSIAFSSTSGVQPGAKEVAPRRFVFGIGTDWDVEAHDLHVRIELTKPEVLLDIFGRTSIVPRNATVAVVCEWASQDAGRRLCFPSPPLDEAGLVNRREIVFSIPFCAGEVRGTVRLMLQLVLIAPGRVQEDEKHLACVPGTKLGLLCPPYELVLDGSGSLFPIREMQLGPNGPLWRLEAGWDDPAWDDFGPEAVAMEVNRDHPSFVELKGSPDAPYRTPLFRESVAAWLTLLLWKIREETEVEPGGPGGGSLWDAITASERPDLLSGSIADAAWHFISRGELDTGSPEALMESAQKWVDSAFRGAD